MSGIANSTSVPPSGNNYDVVVTNETDNSILDPSYFLELMIVEMQNQDFTDPVDNSEMVAQMASFTNLQLMEEMAEQSNAMYAMNLVGKTVTASRFNFDGSLDTTTGTIDKISLIDNEYIAYIGDKTYELYQIMEIGVSKTDDINAANFDLEAMFITDESATISWEIPTDDPVKAEELQYTVYYSTNSDFDTVDKVENGIMHGTPNQTGLNSALLNYLSPDTTYYVNVVVADAQGNKSVYKPLVVKTII